MSYPPDALDPTTYQEDNGTMPENVAELAEAVIGRRIVSAEKGECPGKYGGTSYGLVLTLDNGRRVGLIDTSDCCAYTALESFLLNPQSVDHMILGVGSTGGYTTWHIYADFGDVMTLQVGWSCGNAFYYGYGFDITVEDIIETTAVETPTSLELPPWVP